MWPGRAVGQRDRARVWGSLLQRRLAGTSPPRAPPHPLPPPLPGPLPPGTAVIEGHDIRRDMPTIYSLMGVCPQVRRRSSTTHAAC